jgi:hypothetical protein
MDSSRFLWTRHIPTFRHGQVCQAKDQASPGLLAPIEADDTLSKQSLMPKEPERLAFHIGAFTPATLPMARLAEYMLDLARLLGERERVHFVEVAEGSANLVHVIEHEAFPRVRERIATAKTGQGDPEILTAYESIDRKLREDNASAVLVRTSVVRGKLLQFPGASRRLDEQYGPLSEPGQVYGIPISVGGKRSVVNINLQDGDAVHFCEATRDVALEIAPYLFHAHIRAFGTGKYTREVDGVWKMSGFRITHFDVLDSAPLDQAVQRLREVTKRTELPRDIINRLSVVHGD